MAWIELHQSLFTHRKTMEAADALDLPEVYVVGHLAALWTWALDNAPDGIINASARVISKAAQWTQDPVVFVDALIKAEFLIRTEDGSIVIHDWTDYAGKLIDRRQANADRQRKWRESKCDTRVTGQAHNAPATEAEKPRNSHVTVMSPSRNGATQPNPTVPNPTQQDSTPDGVQEAASPPSRPREEAPAVVEYGARPIPKPPRDKSKPRFNPGAFDAFWSLYPKRENRAESVRLWDTLRLDDDTLGQVMRFVEAAKQTDRWRRGFIPAPDVFLRQQRWTDELSAYADPTPRASPPDVRRDVTPELPPGTSALGAATADRLAHFQALRERAAHEGGARQ